MKKVLFSLAFLFAATSSLAMADGFEEAEKLCTRLFSSSDQTACLKIVSAGVYFESGAVSICGRQFASSGKIECLEAVKDKRFTETVLRNCGSKFSSEQVIECFQASGRKGVTGANEEGLDKAFVRTSLKKALQHIRQRELEKARSVLEGVLESLE